MKPYVFLDVEGYVTRSGSGLTLPEGAIAAPDGVTPAAALQLRQAEGSLVLRPTLIAPEITVFEGSGQAVTFVDLPDGTVAIIEDALIGQELAVVAAVKGVIVIELIDPGCYRIEVTAPRPYLPLVLNLEIAA